MRVHLSLAQAEALESMAGQMEDDYNAQLTKDDDDEFDYAPVSETECSDGLEGLSKLRSAIQRTKERNK